MYIRGDVDVGGGPLPPSGAISTIIARYGPGLVHASSWRMPAIIGNIQIDPLGNVVANGGLPYDPVSFGGATLGSIGTAQDYVVRYAPDGSHMSSWAMPYQTVAILARADGVLVSRAYDIYRRLEYYPYSGIGAGTSRYVGVGTNSSTRIESLVEHDGAFYGALYIYRGDEIGGRTATSDLAAIARFDPTTLAVTALGGIRSLGATIYDQPEGAIFAMQPTAPRTMRALGRVVGPLAFGSRTLMADRSAFGTYVADLTFAP